MPSLVLGRTANPARAANFLVSAMCGGVPLSMLITRKDERRTGEWPGRRRKERGPEMAKVNGTLVAKLATGAAMLGYVAVIALGGLWAGSPTQVQVAAGETGEPVRQEREVRDNAAAYAALYPVVSQREARDNAAAYA